MPLWLIAILFIGAIVAIFKLPSKGKLRIVKYVLIAIAAIAALYMLAVFLLLGGIK